MPSPVKVQAKPESTSNVDSPAEPSEFMKALHERVGMPVDDTPSDKKDDTTDDNKGEPPVDSNADQQPSSDNPPSDHAADGDDTEGGTSPQDEPADGKPSGKEEDEQAAELKRLREENAALKAAPKPKKEANEEKVEKDPNDINSYSDEDLREAIKYYKSNASEIENADVLIGNAQEVLNKRAGKKGAQEVLDAEKAQKKFETTKAQADQQAAKDFGPYMTQEVAGEDGTKVRVLDQNSELFKLGAKYFNGSRVLKSLPDGGYLALKLAYADLMVAGKIKLNGHASAPNGNGNGHKPANGGSSNPPLMKAKPSASTNSAPPAPKEAKEKKVAGALDRYQKSKDSDDLRDAIKNRITK